MNLSPFEEFGILGQCLHLGCTNNRWVSSVLLVRGRVLEALDSRPQAAEAFQAALRQDVFCVEALEALVRIDVVKTGVYLVCSRLSRFSTRC